MNVASLSDLEEEKHALAAQPTTSQPIGTRSERPYLRQYNQTPDETQQPTTLGTTALVQAVATSPPLDKGKQKEVWFDKSLKKDPSKGLNAFVALTYWHNLPISELILLCPSYFASQRRQERRALRDALTDSESFMTQVPATLLMTMGLRVPNVIWCSNRCHPLPSLLRTYSSKIISMIDLCTILGTLVPSISRGSKSIWSLLSTSSEEASLLLWHLARQVVTTTTTIYGFNIRMSHPWKYT